MTKDLGVNTIIALQTARTKGLVVRDFVSIWGKNRSTGVLELLPLWNGEIPITAPVINPKSGATENRDFQAAGSLLAIPSIPAGLQTEVRTIRIKLSNISTPVINAIRTYDAKMAPIQIHRGYFDPDTRRLVDPATCRFAGYINLAPLKTPRAGGQGSVEVECVSNARYLTRVSGFLLSMETLKLRSGDLFGKYLDVAAAWRIWWGQEEKTLGEHVKAKETWLK
jgi:hypothetical protein